MQRLLSRASGLLLGGSLLALLGGFSCDSDDTAWVAFNADSDAIILEVTASEIGAPVVIDLRSTTGTTVVGTAEVDPGSAPVGTIHRVEVHVATDYIERVGKVSVLAESGDRGSRTFSLRQDSADNGLWVVDITSLGRDGEERTDTLTVQLFEEVPASEETDAQ